MISILIKSAKEFGLKEKQISEWAKKDLKLFGQDNCELSIFFVKPEKILAFNRKYRNLNEPTSVLTFFQGQVYPEFKQGTPEKTLFEKQGSAKGRFLLLGDIIICPLVAEEKVLSIRFLIKHGIKNLLSEISTTKNLRSGSG